MTIRICGDEVMTFDDVLIIKNGKNQRAVENPDGKYPIYGSGGIMGYADDYICEADTVIVGRKGSINNPIFVEEPFWNVDTAFGLVAKREVLLPRYLYYFCRNYDFERLNKAVTIPSLTKSDLLKIEITLPSLEIQEKIVNKLLKIEEVIQARQQQLQKMDELVKARFVELFGDPVSNSYGLPEATLPDLGEFGRGVSKHRPRNDIKLLGGKYPLIQTGDVANAGLYITSYSSTYSELGLKQSKMWDKGTLCITIAANIAKTAILEFDACFPDSVVGFIANERTNNIFVHYWFSFFQAILESQAPESAQKNINLKILSELKVIVPEKRKQDQFASFVKLTDKSKVAVQKALDEAQLLFDSLMQEYFG